MEGKKTVFEMMENDPTLQNELAIIAMIRNDLLNASLILGLQEIKLTVDREYYDFDLFQIVLKVMGFSNERIETSVANFYLNEIQQICIERKKKEKDLGITAMKLYYKLKEMII